MSYSVLLTRDALRDLDGIYGFICDHDSHEKADHVAEEIEKVFKKLNEFPERGAFPEELLSLGIRDFREVFYKPYRIIYRIKERKVYVMLIADGRRHLQEILLKRLLN